VLIMIVAIHVKPEFVEAFKQASIQNATHSIQEAGIIRFDVIQQNDDPARFALIEVYRDAADTARHKETAHYKAWKEAAEPMMAEPRTRSEYSTVFPSVEEWR
jgi:autoinducer 2-degrading protein